MSRASRVTLLVFILSVAAVLSLLGFLTARMLRLERDETLARAEAQRLESIRLALWRMDSAIAPLLAQEATRPYFHYLSYYPEQRAFTRVWEPVLPGEVLIPSPLVEGTPPYVRLHFQITSGGDLTSPQVPRGNDRDLAESAPGGPERVAQYEALLTELASFFPIELAHGTNDPDPHAADTRFTSRGRAQARSAPRIGIRNIPVIPGPNKAAEAAEREYGFRKEAADLASRPAPVTTQTLAQSPEPALPSSALRDEAMRDAGGRRVSPETARTIPPTAAPDSTPAMDADQPSSQPAPELRARLNRAERLGRAPYRPAPPPSADLVPSPFVPRWRIAPDGSPQLLYWRVVRADRSATLQGFWMDWPALERQLLSLIGDLLPGASLQPSVSPDSLDPALSSRLLASMPALLVPAPLASPSIPLWNPAHATLLFTWLATLGAIAAVGLSLRASISLGERRGRFVSAVTHELRTPLTTFCLYSQMLADGMIADEAARQEYLDTLKSESTRLQRIVENVLEFARLNRPRPLSSTDPVALGEALDRVLPSLHARAAQCSLRLETAISPEARAASVRVSTDSLGRILLNLVDNACKYAADSSPSLIELEAAALRSRVVIRVTDHGPGIPPRERRRIFRPFARGRSHHDSPAQGIGLGLSLSQALARSLRGDLNLDYRHDRGASFVLWLPLASEMPDGQHLNHTKN